MKVALSVILAVSLVLGGIMLVGPAESGEVMPIVLASHLPIRIDSDADFPGIAMAGDGSAGNPWVIENLEINGTESSRYCIYVGNTTEYFTISNCSVYNINGSYVGDGYFSNAGILICNVTNGLVRNNTAFQNPGDGIAVWESGNVTVALNNLNNNTGDGIFFTSANNSLIQNNNITYSQRGVAFTWAENNTISGNHITNISSKFGIYIGASLNNTLTNNTMLNCGIHFLEGNFLEHWASQTIDTLNTVNGQPVYYWKNLNGGTVPIGAGQVILANCSGVSAENQVIDNGSYGVSMGFCSNVSVENSSFSNNLRGISLYESDYSHISDCSFSNNSLAINVAKSDNSEVTDSAFGGNDDLLRIDGSYNIMDGNSFNANSGNIFFQSGNYNKVTNNSFSNGYGGISTFLSWYNQITDNDFISNQGTISVGWDGGGHKIFHNNFINNTNPPMDDGSTDSEWDDGYPSGGNYWSDYSGTDNYYGPDQDIWGKDGMGDSNYSITGFYNPADNYPLMQPYTGQPLGPDVAQAPFALFFTPNTTAEPADVPIIIIWNETMDWASVEAAFSYTDGASNWTSANGTWAHAGNVSTFTPTDPFAYETHYVVTVNSSASDTIGNMLDQNRNGTGGEWDDFLQWGFTTTDETPYVISTQPADGQFDVDPHKPLIIVFSEAMNRTSVEDAFSYTDGNLTWNVTSGSAYWNTPRTEFTFSPAQPLETNTSFTARLNGTAADAGGKALQDGNFTWDFMTWGAPPAPKVTSTYPPDGAFGVNVNTYINVAFDSEMDIQSVEDAFTFTNGTAVLTAANGTVDWFSDNTLFSFQPTEKLNFDTTYTVRISSEAMSIYGVTLDGDMNGVAEQFDNYTFGFTTTAEPPTVVSHYPTPSQTGVPTSVGAVYINFSAVMLINTVTSAVSISPNTPFTPSFSGGGRNLTMVLNAELLEGTEYRVTVLGTATDMSGVKLDGNADGWPGDRFTFVFYTEGAEVPEEPRIVTIFPLNNATIPAEAGAFYVGVSFNNVMNRTSVENAFRFANASGEVNGTFTWSSTGKTFRFTPAGALAYNMTYTVTMSGTAKDEKGMSLGNTTTWQYITEAQPVEKSILDWVLYGVIIGLLALTAVLYMANRALRLELKRSRVKIRKLKKQAGIPDEPAEASPRPEEEISEAMQDKPENPEPPKEE